MGEAEGYSSNEEATQSARPIEGAKRKGKAVVNEGLAQKKQRIEPSRSATSQNENYILIVDESLDEIDIPSPVHEENVEEDEQPLSPTGTEVLGPDNEIDVEEGEFQEGMISALRDIMCEKDNPEAEGIEQPTVLDWLKERLKIDTSSRRTRRR